MKTRAKRLAAILMAAVMMTAMAVPVFAASDTTENAADTSTTGTTAITSMDFTKTVDADENTYHPDETFTFTVTGASVTEGEKYNNAVVSAGTGTGTITASNVVTDNSLLGSKIYKSSLDFTQLRFDQPGIYKYTVTEGQGTNKDMTYDTTRNLYVYVRWNSEKTATEIYGAAMSKDTTTANKDANFVNEYKKSNKTEEVFKDLTIEKTVTGTQGDTSKLFSFTLTIKSGSGRKYYKVSTTANGSAVQLESGKPYPFELKDKDKIVVENLSANDDYTITEADYTSEGYKTKIGSVETNTQTGKMPQQDLTVTFENNKEAVTPTGIFMNYGPYIAMIAAAAVLAFVFLRRKEEL